MNQLTWTFVDDFGTHNMVGVAHGAQTGHLMVYCNAKIILIDFKVLSDYDYTFFIGDELVKLEIRPAAKGKFSYSCEIDKKADTPRNRARQQKEKKEWKQMLGLVAGLIGFVLFCSFGAIYLNQQGTFQNQADSLSKLGKTSTVRVIVDYETETLQHQYVANGKAFTKDLPLPKVTPITLENGLILEKEATFQMKYMPTNPYFYKIYYNQPTANQRDKWIAKAIELQVEQHPKRTSGYHKCLVKLAYEQQKLTGLITILNQKNAPQAYQRLIKDVPFQNALAARCW